MHSVILMLTKSKRSEAFVCHHFCAGKKCWKCSRGKIVTGQNNTFALVVPGYRGIFPYTPVESAAITLASMNKAACGQIVRRNVMY